MKNELSRRKFLQTGALATGGLMAAGNIQLDAHPAYKPVKENRTGRYNAIWNYWGGHAGIRSFDGCFVSSRYGMCWCC